MEKVVEALLKPQSYEEDVREVKLLQTHISFVFLTGKYTYKVKKPVDFGFLDFTTLEKRKFYCEEELRLNAPLAGDIYVGVVPVVETEEGEIKVNARGKVIEYAVKMVQLPQESIMGELLKRGEVKDGDVREISRLVAGFHSQALSDEEIRSYGSFDQVKANWVENFEQTRELRGRELPREDFDALEGKVMSYVEENSELFQRRVEEGKVKECHGDLHSGNVFIVREPGELYGQGIYIFDAIEFSKAFRNSDVLADVAFMAMDLDFFGREDLGRLFIETYFRHAGEEGEQGLLNFYKCYRAYVRMKVTGFKLSDRSVGEGEKEECRGLVKEYFDLALKYSQNF